MTDPLIETALVAFATMFATIGPLDVAVVYASLTAGYTTRQRYAVAVKGTAVGAAILLVFAVFGEAALALFGITLPALRIAGGILLLLIAIDMVFARSSGGTSATPEERREAQGRENISVFPLGTPLLAGPGAMGAIILLMSDVEGDPAHAAVTVAAMLAVLILALVSMLLAVQLQRLLGQTGIHVITRVFGVLLAALAVQFMLDGLANSVLFESVLSPS